MAKKVVSVAIQKKKKKPIRRIISSKTKNDIKIMFNKIINYMKSDTYMFAPLLNPHLPSSPASCNLGEMSCEPLFKKKGKKSLLEDYLKYDCYMYAPALSLAPNPPVIGKADMGSNASDHRLTKEDENVLKGYSSREINDDKIDDNDTFAPTTPLVVKHYSKLLQRETIKRVVHHQNQNRQPLSENPGKGISEKLWRK